MSATTSHKVCIDCRAEGQDNGGMRPASDFCRVKKNKDGLDNYCRLHRAMRRNRHRANNPGWNRAAQQNRRARITAVGGVLTKKDVELVRALMPRCCKCGTTEALELDHVMPLALGGRNDIFNAQTLCRHCNASKKDSYADYRPFPIIPLICPGAFSTP